MTWLHRMLICTIVATSIFIAVLSGCSLSDQSTTDGGFCSETQIAPYIPQFDADIATEPAIRLFLLVLIISTAIWIIKNHFNLRPTTYNLPTRFRSKRSNHTPHSKPFTKDVYLPYLFATRDP